MATFSQTNIKCSDLELVLSELKKLLPIGREQWEEDRKEWLYNLEPDNNLTIIASKNQCNDWVEIEFDFQDNLYFYDEYLRRISKSLNTEILLGYMQTTMGEGRLAKFSHGNLELSFYEKYSDVKIYCADNFGVANSTIEALKRSRLLELSHLCNYDFIYEYWHSEGWENNLDLDYFKWTYLHLEQIKHPYGKH